MPRAVVEATDTKAAFSDGYPAGWSCLLFKTSGVPFFSGIDFQGAPRPNPTWEIPVEMLHFVIGRGRRQRLWSVTGASATLAPLVV